MSEAYSDFAKVYDELMDNIPYNDWFSYLHGILKEYNINKGLAAELGCGTGTITELMSASGYSMIGIDNSPDMLNIAKKKQEATGSDTLYLCQDMRSFELYGTVSCIVSICDCINYITEKDELIQVFSLVNNYLDPRGIFVFDFNTKHYYKDTVGSSTIAETRDDISFIWDNYYDTESDINELELTLFIKEEKDSELFRRHTEYHYQRGYTLKEIKDCIRKSGLEFVNAYKAFTKETASDNDDRIYIIAREYGK